MNSSLDAVVPRLEGGRYHPCRFGQVRASDHVPRLPHRAFSTSRAVAPLTGFSAARRRTKLSYALSADSPRCSHYAAVYVYMSRKSSRSGAVDISVTDVGTIRTCSESSGSSDGAGSASWPEAAAMAAIDAAAVGTSTASLDAVDTGVSSPAGAPARLDSSLCETPYLINSDSEAVAIATYTST